MFCALLVIFLLQIKTKEGENLESKGIFLFSIHPFFICWRVAKRQSLVVVVFFNFAFQSVVGRDLSAESFSRSSWKLFIPYLIGGNFFFPTRPSVAFGFLSPQRPTGSSGISSLAIAYLPTDFSFLSMMICACHSPPHHHVFTDDRNIYKSYRRQQPKLFAPIPFRIHSTSRSTCPINANSATVTHTRASLIYTSVFFPSCSVCRDSMHCLSSW